MVQLLGGSVQARFSPGVTKLDPAPSAAPRSGKIDWFVGLLGRLSAQFVAARARQIDRCLPPAIQQANRASARVMADRRSQCDRLREGVASFEDAARAHPDNDLSALRTLVNDRRLLPEDGVMHVVGPGSNIHEWLLPAMLRPDAKIIVSEPDAQNVHGVLSQFERFAEVVGEKPDVAEAVGYPTEEAALRRFHAEICDRVWVVADVHQDVFRPGDAKSLHPFDSETPVPKADLVLALSPHEHPMSRELDLGSTLSALFTAVVGGNSERGGCGYEAAGKPGGLVWVVTERASPVSPLRAQLDVSGGATSLRALLRFSPRAADGVDLFPTMGIGDPWLAIAHPPEVPETPEVSLAEWRQFDRAVDGRHM